MKRFLAPVTRIFAADKTSENALSHIRKRDVSLRNLHIEGGSKETSHSILRVFHTGHQRHYSSDKHRILDPERVIRNHAHTVFNQEGSHRLTYGIASDQNCDLRKAGAVCPRRFDALIDLLKFIRLVAECKRHISGRLVRLGYLLFHVSIDCSHLSFVAFIGHLVDDIRSRSKEPVIESYNRRETPVVGIKNLLLMAREHLRNSLVKQFPIGSSPSVYALLHISHYEVLSILTLAVVKQRVEVLPLDMGRILELIQKEVLETYAKFLIYERSIRPVDYILEDSVGIIDAQNILFLHYLLERAAEFIGDTEGIQLRIKYHRRIVNRKLLPEQGDKFIERSLQGGIDLRKHGLRLGLCKPLFRISSLGHERFRRRFYLRIGLKFRIVMYLAEKLSVSLLGVHSGTYEHRDHCLGLFHHLASERIPQFTTFFPHGQQAFLRAHDLFIHPRRMHSLLTLRRHQTLCHIKQVRVKTIASSCLDLLQHIGRQPRKKSTILLGKGIQNPVHAFCHKGLLIQFDLIRRELTDFPRECLESLLEELVYRTYSKGTVIMEDITQDGFSLLPHLIFRLEERRHKPVMVS